MGARLAVRLSLRILGVTYALRLNVFDVGTIGFDSLECVSAQVSLVTQQTFQNIISWEATFVVFQVLRRGSVRGPPLLQRVRLLAFINLLHCPAFPSDQSWLQQRQALCHRQIAP